MINDSANETLRLYNMSADAEERHDLAEQFPDLAKTHFERLDQWWYESLDARTMALIDS